MFQQLITDWKFWSVVISLFALVLSQLPPVHIMIRKANLDFEVYSRIFITHKIGNPNLQVHVILRNLGGRTIRVKKIRGKVLRDGDEVMNLPAQSYIADPMNNQFRLLTSFNIKPDEEWGHNVSFLNYFDRNYEEKYREAEVLLASDIFERKQAALPGSGLVTVDEQLVKPFNELFEKHFNWLPGDYIIELSVETDNTKVDVVKKYRFIMFESLTDNLKKHKEGFSSGATICWESPLYNGLNLEVKDVS